MRATAEEIEALRRWFAHEAHCTHRIDAPTSGAMATHARANKTLAVLDELERLQRDLEQAREDAIHFAMTAEGHEDEAALERARSGYAAEVLDAQRARSEGR